MSPFSIMLLLSAVVCSGVIYVLNKYCINKFEYAFISKYNLYVSMSYTAFLFGGSYFLSKDIHHDTTPYGWTLIAIGVVIIGCLIRINCNRTNLWYGLTGSLIQIPLLLVIATLAFPIFMVGLILKFCTGFAGPPAPQKPFHVIQQEWHYDRMNPNGHYKKYDNWK